MNLYLLIAAGIVAPFSVFIAKRRGLENAPIISALLFILIGCLSPSMKLFILCQIFCGSLLILFISLTLLFDSLSKKQETDYIGSISYGFAIGIQFLFFSLLFGGIILFIRNIQS